MTEKLPKPPNDAANKPQSDTAAIHKPAPKQPWRDFYAAKQPESGVMTCGGDIR